METQYQNYSNSDLAKQDLDRYLQEYQQEARAHGCILPQ